MKYFFDTEFIEGFKKPLKWLPTIGNFNKPQWNIQLISIGIVCEDGREYYTISNEFNPKDANQWVKENVLNKLPSRVFTGNNRYETKLWKSKQQIANEIKGFIYKQEKIANDIHFYAYYADYDWVLLCTLFGTMMDLPKGFPRYCIDLKQMLDEKVEKINWLYLRDIWGNSNRSIYTIGKGDHQEKDRLATFEEKLSTIKEVEEYPKQTNEHNALEDAKWNKELYEFIKAR
jgi:hypothetical protein